ncbi:MAG TPA: hypothetical protein DDW28_07215 [Prevotella sp.]|nr:hypothetical protein [Candidatus Segatella violae]
MQAEHYARTVRLSTIRGGYQQRMQSAESAERFNFNLGIWGGRDSYRLETAEDNSVELFSKKKYKRPSELQHNECRNSLTSLAIPRAATRPTSPQFGGAIFTDYKQCA